jgi:hypothetical protein
VPDVCGRLQLGTASPLAGGRVGGLCALPLDVPWRVITRTDRRGPWSSIRRRWQMKAACLRGTRRSIQRKCGAISCMNRSHVSFRLDIDPIVKSGMMSSSAPLSR